MYHPKSASHKIATGQIENSNSVKEPPKPRKNYNPANDVISIPGPGNVIHKGIVVQGRALGPGAENTHFFDGKLVDSSFMSLIEEKAAEDIKENIVRAGNIEHDVKKKAFERLDQFIHTQKEFRVSPNATKCLRTIINIHDVRGRSSSGGNQNYSPSDNLHACDLLYLLYEKIVEENNKEYLNLLLTQLDEMATGMCPAGRSNRLFQTYVMLRDDLTPTSKPMDVN